MAKAQECPGCGKPYAPTRETCPHCGADSPALVQERNAATAEAREGRAREELVRLAAEKRAKAEAAAAAPPPPPAIAPAPASPKKTASTRVPAAAALERACPDCGELLKIGAKRCKACGADFAPAPSASSPERPFFLSVLLAAVAIAPASYAAGYSLAGRYDTQVAAAVAVAAFWICVFLVPVCFVLLLFQMLLGLVRSFGGRA